MAKKFYVYGFWITTGALEQTGGYLGFIDIVSPAQLKTRQFSRECRPTPAYAEIDALIDGLTLAALLLSPAQLMPPHSLTPTALLALGLIEIEETSAEAKDAVWPVAWLPALVARPLRQLP